MRILVDTNLLLRLTENGHPQHEIAREAIRLLENEQHELCVVPQVFYEFWVIATRPTAQNGLGMSTKEASESLRDIKAEFRTLRDERTVFEWWEQLVSEYKVQGKGAHDTRLVAAMMRHDLKHLLTFNSSDFIRYSEIAVLVPENPLVDSLLDS